MGYHNSQLVQSGACFAIVLGMRSLLGKSQFSTLRLGVNVWDHLVEYQYCVHLDHVAMILGPVVYDCLTVNFGHVSSPMMIRGINESGFPSRFCPIDCRHDATNDGSKTMDTNHSSCFCIPPLVGIVDIGGPKGFDRNDRDHWDVYSIPIS